MTRFEYELGKLIAEEISRLKNCLLSRPTISNYDAYNFYVGQIIGLQRVVDVYFDEANKLVDDKDK